MFSKVNLQWLLLFAAIALIKADSNNSTTDPPDALENGENSRGAKALSVFQVVRFPNIVCSGSSSYNGTCYTSTECSAKGGTSAGSCASGFGVCCVFTVGCGATIAQNCTYFISSTSQPAGACGVTICKCSSDICQLRMDFSTFVIAGPSTSTYSITYEQNGGSAAAAGVAVTDQTQCLTDTFSVTGGSASTPPVICGTNSGYHMYVDASNACNLLNFELGPTGIGTTIPTRSWSIKITQISCYDPYLLAPSGCTQYFYGSTSGTISSYNYANSVELANQLDQFCFRRERGYCRICFSPTSTSDYAISGSLATKGFGIASKCCGYGKTGKASKTGYDCIMIPGAMTVSKANAPNSFCGQKYLVSTKSGTTGKTICSNLTPFVLTFLTDNWTYTPTTTAVKGFKIAYWETTC